MKLLPSGPKRVTLLVTIQTIFLTICLLLAGLLTGYGFIKNRQAAIEGGKDLLEELSQSVINELTYVLDRPTRVALRLPHVPKMKQRPKNLDHPALDLMINSLMGIKEIQGIYIGWADGEFYQVMALRDNEELKQTLNAPEDAEFIIEHITLEGIQRMATIGFTKAIDSKITNIRTQPTDYDPRKRPWYKRAQKNPNKTGFVPVYIFQTPPVLGTTIANTFENPSEGVFGIDITIGTIVDFLKKQAPGEKGRIVAFTRNGQVTLHDELTPEAILSVEPDHEGAPSLFIDDLEDPIIKQIYEQFAKGGTATDTAFYVDGEDESYLAKITPFIGRQRTIYISISAPESHFTGAVRQIYLNNFLFSVIIISIAVIAVVFVSRRISTPLKRLATETDEIRKFNLETEVDVQSRITEVANLAESISGMKDGIETFTQYVPKDLVRNYIASGTKPDIGGDSRELTILFSDIADFTTISEPMQPETVIGMLSHYFSEMGHEVTEMGGTIDKYIGDALMAFWNAPVENEQHTIAACEATLRCAKVVDEYLFTRTNGETVCLRTRFGLHRGDAVVGNMGSSDRLNYTALGGTINIGSRIEGLNKHYGTTILASQSIKDNAGELFVFRSVDKVLPKGALTPLNVYELVGCKPGCDLVDHIVPEERLEFLKKWEQAYELYHRRRWIDVLELLESMPQSGDKLVAIYLDRTRRYMQDEPPADWDGVEVMTGK